MPQNEEQIAQELLATIAFSNSLIENGEFITARLYLENTIPRVIAWAEDGFEPAIDALEVLTDQVEIIKYNTRHYQ